MAEPSYDIFSGLPDKSAKWLESVEGLDGAQRRMRELSEQSPGQYFIFSVWNSSIVAQVDTANAAFDVKSPDSKSTLLRKDKVKVAGAA
jgi:hypothetical protein